MDDIARYVKVFTDAVPQHLVADILSEYEESDEWAPTGVRSSDGKLYVDKQFRDTDTILISRPDVLSRNREARTAIDQAIYDCLSPLVGQYMQEFGTQGALHLSQDTGYELLRYPVGGFFREHADAFDGTNRVLSCSIALNDEFEGGEWSFFKGRVRFKAPKGSATFFPSNFMFPHEILEVTRGTRFSIVTWFN